MALAAAGAAAGLVSTGLVSTGFAAGFASGALAAGLAAEASGALAAGAAAVGFVSTFFSGFADEGAHSLRRSPQVTLFYLKNGSFLLLPKLFSSAYGGGVYSIFSRPLNTCP